MIGQIFANYSLFIFKDLIDSVESSNTNTAILISITFTFLGYKALHIILNAFGYYLNDHYSAKAMTDTKINVITHIHNLDFAFHAKKQSGSLISAIKRGESAFLGIDYELNRNVVALIVDYFFIIYAFINIELNLALITIFSVIINLAITSFLLQKNIKARKTFNDEDDKVSGLVVDNMINYETVKLFAQEKWEQDRLHRQYIPWFKSFFQYSYSFRYIDLTSGAISLIGSAVAIIMSIFMLDSQQISLGQFSLIIAFVTTFFPKLSWLTYQIRSILKQLTDLEKFLNILDFDIEIKDPINPNELSQIKGDMGRYPVKCNIILNE